MSFLFYKTQTQSCMNARTSPLEFDSQSWRSGLYTAGIGRRCNLPNWQSLQFPTDSSCISFDKQSIRRIPYTFNLLPSHQLASSINRSRGLYLITKLDNSNNYHEHSMDYHSSRVAPCNCESYLVRGGGT